MIKPCWYVCVRECEWKSKSVAVLQFAPSTDSIYGERVRTMWRDMMERTGMTGREGGELSSKEELNESCTFWTKKRKRCGCGQSKEGKRVYEERKLATETTARKGFCFSTSLNNT